MTTPLSSLLKIPDMELVSTTDLDAGFTGGFTSDLLSDVMGNAQAGDLLITIQAHKNTVAVATLAELPAIIVCSSRPIPDDMTEAAQKEGIAIFRTPRNQFQMSAALDRFLNP